jgi:signal transduction histidine kinase
MTRHSTAGVLSASIAHELNQPLGAILSNAEAADLILNSPSPNLEEIKEILIDIRRDDERASEVIRRLRRLLKKTALEVQDIDLNELVRDVLELLSGQSSARNVTLSAMLSAQGVQVSGDPVQLQQVILNLILNGIEAMTGATNGERKITICTELLDGALAEVSIADSGPGIPLHKLKQVFEPFFTTKEHGMGMGLSIARTIIEAHGGRIWAEKQTGNGAVFRFTLPLAKRH